MYHYRYSKQFIVQLATPYNFILKATLLLLQTHHFSFNACIIYNYKTMDQNKYDSFSEIISAQMSAYSISSLRMRDGITQIILSWIICQKLSNSSFNNNTMNTYQCLFPSHIYSDDITKFIIQFNKL